MAGDWIKMRTSLLTNPRVNGIARLLESDASVSRVLTTGFNGVMSQIVTRNVMRHVTVSSLLVVWGAANEHTRDGVFRNADLSDVDDMVGVPGFGAAMEAVGWASFDAEACTVTLPNFNEYNTSSSERSATAKGSAERQRDYRERKKSQESDVTRDVTNDVTRYRREEKRREEENKEISAHAGNADAQNPQPEPEQPNSRLPETGAPPAQPHTQHPAQPSPEGLACLAMRTAGLEVVNPADPRLRELVKAGVQPEEFAAAATEAVAKGKKFAYALAVVAGRRTDAVQMAEAAARAGGPPPPRGAGAMPGDIARATVPGPKGRDPVLLAMDREEAEAVKPPPEIRAKMAALSAKRPTSAGAEA